MGDVPVWVWVVLWVYGCWLCVSACVGLGLGVGGVMNVCVWEGIDGCE